MRASLSLAAGPNEDRCRYQTNVLYGTRGETQFQFPNAEAASSSSISQSSILKASKQLYGDFTLICDLFDNSADRKLRAIDPACEGDCRMRY